MFSALAFLMTLMFQWTVIAGIAAMAYTAYIRRNGHDQLPMEMEERRSRSLMWLVLGTCFLLAF